MEHEIDFDITPKHCSSPKKAFDTTTVLNETIYGEVLEQIDNDENICVVDDSKSENTIYGEVFDGSILHLENRTIYGEVYDGPCGEHVGPDKESTNSTPFRNSSQDIQEGKEIVLHIFF